MIVEKLFASSDGGNSAKEVVTEGNAWDVLTGLFNREGRKKVRVDNADVFDDIYACVNILSDDIAKLPVKIYKKTDGAIERIGRKDHNIAKLLTAKPNDIMSISDYKKLLMVDVLIAGNHYSAINKDKNGKVVSLIPLPNSTEANVDLTGKLTYQTVINGKRVIFQPWEIIHIKGFTRDGIHGKSPIRVIAERAESNQLANEFNINLIEQGGSPKGILRVPGLLDKDAKTKAKDEWKKVNGSDSIAVVDSGLEYQQIGFSQEDMQFIESQKYNQQKISAIFKVPLHKLNELGRATYSNIEHQALEYVKNTLQPWITRIEEEWNTKLFSEDEQDQDYYIKFNLDSELRGDSETRAKVDKIKIESGSNVLNEVRERNEDSPYEPEFGDRPLITLNYTFLDNLLSLQNSKAGVESVKDLKGGEKENDED